MFLFQQLVKTGENNWSLPELVHAVVLLAHYHALASFVFGSGINPERDLNTSNGYRLISVNNFCVCDVANDNNNENASLTSNNFGVSFGVSAPFNSDFSSLSYVCQTGLWKGKV